MVVKGDIRYISAISLKKIVGCFFVGGGRTGCVVVEPSRPAAPSACVYACVHACAVVPSMRGVEIQVWCACAHAVVPSMRSVADA